MNGISFFPSKSAMLVILAALLFLSRPVAAADRQGSRPTDRGPAGSGDPYKGIKENHRNKYVRWPDRSKELAARAKLEAAIAAHTPGSGGAVRWSDQAFAGLKKAGNRKPILLYIYNSKMDVSNKAAAYNFEERVFRHKGVLGHLKGWTCLKAESPVEGLAGVDARTGGAKLLLITYDGTVWRRFTSAPPPDTFPGQLEFVARQNARLLKENGLAPPEPEKKKPAPRKRKKKPAPKKKAG